MNDDQKARSSNQDLPHLPAALCLAEKVGAQLGFCEVLQPALPPGR